MQASTSSDGRQLVVGRVHSLTELLGVAGYHPNYLHATLQRISPGVAMPRFPGATEPCLVVQTVYEKQIIYPAASCKPLKYDANL